MLPFLQATECTFARLSAKYSDTTILGHCQKYSTVGAKDLNRTAYRVSILTVLHLLTIGAVFLNHGAMTAGPVKALLERY